MRYNRINRMPRLPPKNIRGGGIGGESVVIDLGTAAEDGKSAASGLNTVTPERIPMLFSGDGFFSVIFIKESGEETP